MSCDHMARVLVSLDIKIVVILRVFGCQGYPNIWIIAQNLNKTLKTSQTNLTGGSNINHWELQIHKIDYLIGFKRPIFVSVL